MERLKYHTLEDYMIPAYMKDPDYIKLLIAEIYAVLKHIIFLS